MQVTFIRSEQIGPSAHTFYFSKPTAKRYEPGQFIELTLSMKEQRTENRWFTLSSSPTEDELAVTTKIPQRPNEYKAKLLTMTPGDLADISEPMGEFILPMDTSRPIVGIAAGIGITPFRSMVTWLIDTHASRDMTLFYGVRHEDDLLYADLLASADFLVMHTLVSQPSAPQPHTPQHLTTAYIMEHHTPKPDTLYYLAGPEHLVEALGGQLRNAGIHPSAIVTDFFAGYGGE